MEGAKKKARNPFLVLNGFENDFLRLLLANLDIESAANISAVCRRWRRIILHESDFFWERQTSRLCFHGFLYPFAFTKCKFKVALYWTFHNYNAADPIHLKAVFNLFKQELYHTQTNPHVAAILEHYAGSRIQPFTYTVELAKNWYLLELPPPYKIGDDFLVDWAQAEHERRNLYFCENYAILTRSTVGHNRRWTPWKLLHVSDLIGPYREKIN